MDVLTGLAIEYQPKGIRSDYAPDKWLAVACETAGIAEERVPWKSGVVVQEGKLFAWKGYGQPARQIWPAADIEKTIKEEQP